MTAGHVPVPVRLWVRQMLRNRAIYLELNGEEAVRITSTGTPQGGVLSPTLWNLALNPLLITIEQEFPEVLIQAYADDVTVMLTGIDPSVLRIRMTMILTRISKWCDEHGLGFNKKKTELVMFTLNKKWTWKKLMVDGEEVPLRTQTKYLGLILDSKLTWTKQIEERTRKARVIMVQCKNIIGRKWGLKPNMMHWLYTAIVRPVMTYACVIWVAGLLDAKTKVGKLQKIQRMSLLERCDRRQPQLWKR